MEQRIYPPHEAQTFFFSETFSVSPHSIIEDILWGTKQSLSILALTTFGKGCENQDKKCDPKNLYLYKN